MLSNERYQFILECVKGVALDAVWLYLEDDSQSYEERKEKFLWMLKKMVDERLITLAKDGILIRDSIEDVLDQFRMAFPAYDGDLNNGIWFFTPSCPCGIGWLLQDGSIDWA
ncbi:hypothetical protein RB25_25325 [Herbaspirillum rubrisubalbicans]|uniref:DUF596 domain-containing protein n=1 Tax=Herbaspirillum rubrisubalbicans TaxID=80842 RepID=UPI000DC53D8D|nr:DUF596 domain-containing protein [Herbaspirillum rubrisubalbicans]RAN42719.1 hypothetical protein RB25_25325 [Herbaspirillum rubrisubalbicans]